MKNNTENQHIFRQKIQNRTKNIPFLGIKLSLCISSTAGIKNANVFPEPVFAAPRISL